MKIIQSFLLFIVCLTATNLLQAQEVKTEVLKQTEVKAPPVPTAANIPSPAPQLIPMNGITPTTAPVAASQTASASKKEEDKKTPEDLKIATATRDANAATNKLSAEQLKTLNGTTEKPKQMAPVVLDAQNAKSQSIIAPAPAVVKEQ